MSGLNKIIDFKDLVHQQQIIVLNEKIKALEAVHERFEITKSRVIEQEKDNIELRLQLAEEREKSKQLSIKNEKSLLLITQYSYAESSAKTEIYGLENQCYKMKLGQYLSSYASLKTDHEILKTQYEQLRLRNSIEIYQLSDRESQLKTRNNFVTQERDSAVDKLMWTKNELEEQRVKLDLIKQELATANSICGQLESECKAKLDCFEKCSVDYKSDLLEKQVAINDLQQVNTELKIHVKELEKKIEEQRESAKELEKKIEEHEQVSVSAFQFECELKGKNILIPRLQKELETYKTQAQQSNKLASDQKTMIEQLSAKLEKAEAEHVNLTGEKFRLEQALQDTSYQLQHLIFDVHKRQDPIPASVKQIDNHLTNSKTLPTHLPHEGPVFKDITDIENLSQELFRLQIEHAENTFSVRPEIQSKTDKLFDDAKKQLADIKEQLFESQKQKEILEQKLLAKPAPVQEDKSEAFISLYAEFQEISEDSALYRASTTRSMALMQTELEKSGHSEREYQNLVQSLQGEISMVQSQFIACQDALQQKACDIENARHQMAFTHSQYEDQKAKLGITIQELNERETSMRALQLENFTLQTQYDAQTKMCDVIQQEMTESNTERAKLSSMLESINARVKESEVIFAEETQAYKARSVVLRVV